MADEGDQAELVRRLRSDDETVRREAQKIFVEKYKERICRRLRILLRDFGVNVRSTTVGVVKFSSQVNSLFNDVWMATIARLHSGELTDGELDLIAYMFRTAQRFLINKKRKEVRRRTYANEHPELFTSNDAPHEEKVENREIIEKYRQDIAQLPQRCRLLITLRIDEKLSFEKIGEIMDLPDNSARARYHDCIKLLRDTAGENKPEV